MASEHTPARWGPRNEVHSCFCCAALPARDWKTAAFTARDWVTAALTAQDWVTAALTACNWETDHFLFTASLKDSLAVAKKTKVVLFDHNFGRVLVAEIASSFSAFDK